jgi:hypothetical protein
MVREQRTICEVEGPLYGLKRHELSFSGSSHCAEWIARDAAVYAESFILTSPPPTCAMLIALGFRIRNIQRARGLVRGESWHRPRIFCEKVPRKIEEVSALKVPVRIAP